MCNVTLNMHTKKKVFHTLMKEDLLSYWRLNLLFEKFVRASVDLSATSSQNGLIREASFLAETFLIRLTTQRRVMLYSRGFWSIGCPRSWHASYWYREVTQAHVKLRQIYALPNVIISVFYSLTSFSLLCGSGLGDPIYVTRQLSTGQPGRLQRSLKWKAISTPQNTEMKL